MPNYTQSGGQTFAPDGTLITAQIGDKYQDANGKLWQLDASGNAVPAGGGAPPPAAAPPPPAAAPPPPSSGGGAPQPGGASTYQDKLGYIQQQLGRSLSPTEIQAGFSHFGGDASSVYGLSQPQLDDIVSYFRQQGPSGGGGGGGGAPGTPGAPPFSEGPSAPGAPVGTTAKPGQSAYEIAATQAPTFQAPEVVKPPAFSYGDFSYDPFAYDAFKAPTAQDVFADPSYQFRLDQGQGALQNSKAAQGVLGTGGTIKDFIDYGQNFASQEYGNAYNRAAQNYNMNRANAADIYNTNRSNALQNYASNRANALTTYNTNYATQYTDPWQMSFQNAQATLQPQELGYTSMIGTSQHAQDAYDALAQHAKDQSDLYGFNNKVFDFESGLEQQKLQESTGNDAFDQWYRRMLIQLQAAQ